VDRPRSCQVIYYFDTPALGIRHQLFDRVTWHLTTPQYGSFWLIDTTIVVMLPQKGQLIQPLTVRI
jgi:hypothetical protein